VKHTDSADSKVKNVPHKAGIIFTGKITEKRVDSSEWHNDQAHDEI